METKKEERIEKIMNFLSLELKKSYKENTSKNKMTLMDVMTSIACSIADNPDDKNIWNCPCEEDMKRAYSNTVNIIMLNEKFWK